MQIAIDGCKKQFVVNAADDIKRIRKSENMKREKDYPKFMLYTKEIPQTKNGVLRPLADIKKDRERLKNRIDPTIDCPMNWMQERLEKIQGMPKTAVIDTIEFLAPRPPGKPKATQMSKVRKIVEDFDRFYASLMIQYENDKEFRYAEAAKAFDEMIEAINGMNIGQITVYRLVQTSLGFFGRTNTDKIYQDATKHTMRMLTVLHKTNREKFLNCFVSGFACDDRTSSKSNTEAD